MDTLQNVRVNLPSVRVEIFLDYQLLKAEFYFREVEFFCPTPHQTGCLAHQGFYKAVGCRSVLLTASF